MAKIIFPGAPKGQHVLNDRYVFQDGVMECSNDDAQLMSRILCNYHGCTVKFDDVAPEVAEPVADGSLKAAATKTAPAKAEK